MSRRLRQEGTVLLEVLILKNGTVGEVRLKRTSGYSRLDNAALEAVRGWHFVPARHGNVPVDFWYEQPVVFSLR
jgi:protein TonB